MKSKWLASLVLASSLTSCSIGHEAPSSSPTPQAVEPAPQADGCPTEERCMSEAEATSIAKTMEARAWAAFDSYNFQPVDLSHTVQEEYVGWTDSSDTEVQPGFWRLQDPNNHDVVYIFHSVALTTM